MAELFWPTHELLEFRRDGRKVGVELQGMLLLMYLAERKAAVAETNWATRGPVIVSRAEAAPIEGPPLYATDAVLTQLWKARLIVREGEGLADRLLSTFLERKAFDPEVARSGEPTVDVYVPSKSGLAEVEANRARLDGEMRIGLAKPERYVVVGAERANDGTAVGTGPLCAVLRDRGSELELRVVALPPDGSKGLLFGGELDKAHRPAVVLWDTDPTEWESLLSAEAARLAERDAETGEHARRMEAEAERHAGTMAAVEARWRSAVEAVTGEAPVAGTLPHRGKRKA